MILSLPIGLQITRLPLVNTVIANGLNILFDYLFIVVFNGKSNDAAWATLIAEFTAADLAL